MGWFMRDLKLLVFPDNNINQERLTAVIRDIAESDYPLTVIDGVLCALYDHFGSLDDASMICHDIQKLRGSIEAFYEDDD